MAVVGHFDLECSVGSVDLHCDLCGVGVLGDIGERFLDEPVDGRLKLGREPAVVEGRIGKMQAAVDLDSVRDLVVLGEPLDGWS